MTQVGTEQVSSEHLSTITRGCRPPRPFPFLQGFWDSGENGDTDVPSAKECAVGVGGVVFEMQYRKYPSLGTPLRLTFQARLLHNQEDVNTDRYV